MNENGTSRSRAGLWIWVGLALLVVAGGITCYALRPRPGPPPVEIAGDPLLVQGREFFLSRCASCHGERGKGDGPLVKSLTGPPPRDLTDAEWKHGDKPEQVREVIARGVPGTSMARWDIVYKPDEIRAIAAYVYWLAGRPVPKELREEDVTKQ